LLSTNEIPHILELLRQSRNLVFQSDLQGDLSVFFSNFLFLPGGYLIIRFELGILLLGYIFAGLLVIVIFVQKPFSPFLRLLPVSVRFEPMIFALLLTT
jgi:hypothetical protein